MNTKKKHPAALGERGIALIMVLWVLTVLMVVVLAFSYMGRTESQASLAFRQGLEEKFLAEAGVERAIVEIAYGKMNPSAEAIPEGGEPWRTDGTPYTIKSEGGRCVVSIIDETGKININTLNDSSVIILKNLLLNSGVQEEVADTITDSILDWKDADDLTRLHGAENDYYMSLPTPYKAKNADFETVEELLLVKGMTPEILYGTDKKKGIMDFVTVSFLRTTAINAGAAPKEVLMAVPGITPEVAEAIMASRGNFADAASSANIRGMLAAVKPPFNTLIVYGVAGNAFTIESSAYRGDSKGAYTVKATVIIEGADKYKYVYYKSPGKKPAADQTENNGGSTNN